MFQITLFCLIFGVTHGCYKFPADVPDPCLDKQCHFGAQCRPSPDGQTGECVCPEKCATYGDSRGSRPVCGTDGMDYPNVCQLQRTACKMKREIEVKFQGLCGEWLWFFLFIILFHRHGSFTARVWGDHGVPSVYVFSVWAVNCTKTNHFYPFKFTTCYEPQSTTIDNRYAVVLSP